MGGKEKLGNLVVCMYTVLYYVYYTTLSAFACRFSSRDGEKKSEDGDVSKPKTVDGKEKDLWVSNLGASTRATDLKQVFSKHGRVVGAKVRKDRVLALSLHR